MTEQDPMLKTADVAKRLNVQPVTVHRLIREGKLRGVKIGRVWRIDPASVDALIRHQDDNPQPPTPEL